MSGWSDFFYYFIFSAALMLSMMGLWLTASIPGIDRWSKRFFRGYFFIFMLCCLSSLGEGLSQLYHAPNVVFLTVLIVECLLLPLPMPMLTIFLLHCCGEHPRSSRLMRVVVGLWAVYVVMVACAIFIDGFTYITPDNHYVRGPLYPLGILPMVAIMPINLAGTIRRRARLSPKIFLGFLVGILPMTVALIAQLFVDVFPLIDISMVLSALSMYSFVLSDQIEKDLSRQREIARQQSEIAHQRASIMVLQMRPHFIYNTMSSIYCLCKQDPDLAQAVTLSFTTYLRRNFSAIASAEPIPFSMELEHTRAYLAVEQAQYEDSLFVEYDTPHTMFRLPPLTLQPIVENAIKHGRDPYAGPLHVSIRTRKTEAASEIVVADDGRGFVAPDDDAPHIALNNIRERLHMMCGGSLSIAPNEGGGTVVTVTIPDRAAE